MPDPEPITTHYERVVRATLIVRLDNGEEWPATTGDLTRCGYVSWLDAYMTFQRRLIMILEEAGLLDRDLTECWLNPLRYLVEVAISHPDDLDHRGMAATYKGVAAIERVLRAHANELDREPTAEGSAAT